MDHAKATRGWLARTLGTAFTLALAATMTACFNPDIPSGSFRCSLTDPEPRCPAGQMCMEGWCVNPGDPPPIPGTDAGTDMGPMGTDSGSDGGNVVCGDGIIGAGEDCDGADLGGADCASQGFVGGTLACDGVCMFDTSNCTSCGNGVLDPGEDCDMSALGGEDCTTIMMGFTGGTLACAMDCTFDTAGCMVPPNCGNGTLDMGEDCDPMLMPDPLNGGTCDSATGSTLTEGTLACGPACLYDTSDCSECGNMTAEGSEACDTADLGGDTCVSLGFGSGTLACDMMCMHDTSGCSNCGNNMINAPEVCDGTDLGAVMDCTDLGYSTVGAVACTGTCDAFTGCMGTCGDGTNEPDEMCDDMGESATCDDDCTAVMCGDMNINVTAGEDCEGADLNGMDCAGLGFGGGMLACDGSCMFDTSMCDNCGNNMINAPEVCDGTDLAGNTDCTDLGYSMAGTLGCAVTCDAFTGCANTCGDGLVEPGEDCDGDGAGTGGETVTCDTDCTNQMCGDGTVNMTAAETCDDMGESATCDDDCTAVMCGDGNLNTTAGEACDGALGITDCATDCGGGTGAPTCDPSTCAIVCTGCV